MTARWNLIAAFALCAVAAATLFAASPVFAHAGVKASTPAKGEVVTASPPRIEITFTQQIQKIAGTYGIDVAHDRGASVTTGPAVIDETDRSKVSVPLQANLQPGRYVVTWKNVSDADGDPATGAFSFYVGKQPNANDLANDKQLESVGLEAETPGAGSTTTAATPRAAVTTAAGTQSPGISAATPAPTATAPSGGGSGNGNTATYVIIAAAVIGGAVIGFAGWQYAAQRRR